MGRGTKNGQGCHGKCSFCGGVEETQNKIFGNRQVIRRTYSRLADDLITLSRSGIKRVALTNDVSQAPITYWRKLHKTIQDAHQQVGVYIEAEHLPSHEYIKDFSETFAIDHSVITLTVLCENEEVRKKNGKCFSNDEFWDCIQCLKQYGVQCAIYLTVGIPYENSMEKYRRKAFIHEIKKYSNCQYLFTTTLTIDPASPMHQYPQIYNIETTLNSCFDYVERCKLRSLNKPFDKLGYTLKKI